MNEHHIRFEGAAADALKVATVIADADGVDLTSSEPPAALADGRVRLDVTVEATTEAIEAALDEIVPFLPSESSLQLDPS